MKIKRIVIVSLLLLALLISTCMAFADDYDDSNNAKYSDTFSARVWLTISGNNAKCKAEVEKKSTSTANKMVVTTYYYKSGGTYVGSASTTVYNYGNLFTGTTSKTLYSHGTYYAEVLVKLYYNSQLLESYTLNTGTATY